jgi:PilZ domain
MEDRRRMPRVPFVAVCELLEVSTGMRLNAQVSELSMLGCYVDTVHPLKEQTEVYVKVFSDEYFFEAPARVVYCHANLGMGLEFHDIKPHFVGVLQNWLVVPVKRG